MLTSLLVADDGDDDDDNDDVEVPSEENSMLVLIGFKLDEDFFVLVFVDVGSVFFVVVSL